VAGLLRDELQVLVRGKNAVWADEPTDLEEKRIKRGEVDQAESAEENPARVEVSAGAFSVEEPAQGRSASKSQRRREAGRQSITRRRYYNACLPQNGCSDSGRVDIC
jgi:hypothetical protein